MQAWLGIGGLAIGIAGLVIAVYGVKVLNSAFRRTESTIEDAFSQAASTIEDGFSQTASILGSMHEANIETSLIMALGSKGNKPMWSNFLQGAIEEAVDAQYLRTIDTGFVTTPTGEDKLSAYTQEQIRNTVKENPDVNFEELAAVVVEKLRVSRLTGLAKSQGASVNKMIGIIAGFAYRLQSGAK